MTIRKLTDHEQALLGALDGRRTAADTALRYLREQVRLLEQDRQTAANEIALFLYALNGERDDTLYVDPQTMTLRKKETDDEA